MKRYIRSATRKSSQSDLLPGSVIHDRLINLCYWSANNAWGVVEDDEKYTLSELIDILSEECVSSGEFDSSRDAIEWGEECAKAIFENRSPHC